MLKPSMTRRRLAGLAAAASLFTFPVAEAQLGDIGGAVSGATGGAIHSAGQVGGNVLNQTGRTTGSVINQAGRIGGNTLNQAGRVGGNVINQTGRATGNAIPSTTNGASRLTDSTVNNLRKFTTPEAGTPDFGTDVPLRLDSKQVAGLNNRGELGANLNTTGDTLQVGNVQKGTIAADAGLQANDEIVAVNKSWVTSMDQFRNSLSTSLANQGRAWVMVNRNGQEKWLNVNADGATRSAMGASYNVQDGKLNVTRTFDGFAAADSGLKVGDQIVSMNGQKISSRTDYLNQVNSNLGGTIDMVVNRNGSQQTLTAKLPAASSRAMANANASTSADVAANFNWDNQINDLRSSIGDIQGVAGGQYGAEINQLNRQLQTLEQSVASTGDAAENQADRSVGNVTSTLDQMDQTITGLRARANSQVSQQLDSLQQQIDQSRTALNSTVDNTAETVADTASAAAQTAESTAWDVNQEVANAENAVGVAAENAVETATDTTSQTRQQLIRETQTLSRDLQTLAENQQGEAAQRWSSFGDRISSLERTLSDRASGATDRSEDFLQGALSQASDVRSELEAMRIDVDSATSADFEAAINRAAMIEASLRASTMASVDSPDESLRRIQSDLVQGSQQLMNTVQTTPGNLPAQALSYRQQAMENARSLSQQIEGLESASNDELTDIRQAVASTQAQLSIAAMQAEGASRRQFSNAIREVASLRGQVNRYTTLAQPDVTATRLVTQSQDTLASSVSDLAAVTAKADGSTRQTLQSAQSNLEAVQKTLADAPATPDVVQTVRSQRTNVLTNLADARSSLMQAAATAPADVQSVLVKQLATVDLIQDDLLTVSATSETQTEVQVGDSTEAATESETVVSASNE